MFVNNTVKTPMPTFKMVVCANVATVHIPHKSWYSVKPLPLKVLENKIQSFMSV
jgi:hypothetical protein